MLTIMEVARSLRVCDATVRGLIRRKQLRAFRVGGVWRVMKRDFDAYLETCVST